MRIMLRLACSVALRMASGTSRALPAPCPTLPLPSPTTTSAAKPKRRPPFTTLATRLIETSFSTNSPSSRSRSRSRPPFSPRAICPGIPLLKRQSALSSAVGECLHSPVIEITAAIKHNRFDTCRLGPLGHQEPDLLGSIFVGAGLELALELGVERRSGSECHALRVIDDLGIDVPPGPKHAEARPARLAAQVGTDPPLAAVKVTESVC